MYRNADIPWLLPKWRTKIEMPRGGYDTVIISQGDAEHSGRIAAFMNLEDPRAGR
jgi:hypothetical protein